MPVVRRPVDGAEQFCDLCLASRANPNVDRRFKPHTVHNGQHFEVDFDLFCSRMGIKDAPLNPTPEQLQEACDLMARAVDRIILGRAHEQLQAEVTGRDRESDGRDHRGVSEADRREQRASEADRSTDQE